MQARKFLLTVTLPLILLFQSYSFKKVDDRISTLDSLKKAFQIPGKKFKPVPFWVWNGKVGKDIIDSMLNDYKGAGFGGVIIHPRPGLITEYLSNEWYELFRYAKNRSKELDLDVWIYDENSYPTGFAGGLVGEKMPAAYNQGQMLYMERADRIPPMADSILLVLKVENEKTKDISASYRQFKGEIGNYIIIKKKNYQKSNRGSVAGPIGVSYVDLLAKGVTQTFIDVTFKGYEKVAGKDFGQSVVGVFSDEPTIINEGQHSIRWTPDLFKKFKKTWGYELETNLPSLFEEVGEWRKVRHNYHQVLLQLFIDRWSKPMFRYMENHQLTWTGHYWEHGWPSPHHGPDNMAMYAWMQMPGIDMLFNQFNEEKPVQFGNIRAVKELASVANQLNKSRTLSETYGGSGWELTFKDMKRLADWEYVLGVNFLNQHLSFMTITGSRKYDYPPSFSYHEPWWPYYKSLNDYYARLSLALSSGEQKNDILVLEPTTSAWMYYFNGKTHKRFYEIGTTFNDFVTALERMHTEYDLGSENIIKDQGAVNSGKFVVGQRAYTTVVIPPGMENLDRKTFELLERFIKLGGRVVLFQQPQFIDGVEDARLNVFREVKKNIRFASDVKEIERLLPNYNFSIDGIGGKLYHHRRQLSDGQIIFLTNASMTEKTRGKIKVDGVNALLLDPFTGKITDFPETVSEGKLILDVDIEPAGSRLFFVANAETTKFEPYHHPIPLNMIETSGMQIQRPKNNTLMIDFCDLVIRKPDSLHQDLHVGIASNKAFKHYGFSDGMGNPWNNRTQFRDKIVARDTFSTGTGYTATYHFYIDKEVNTSTFKAVLEQPNLWTTVSVNGKELKPLKNQWWLDRSFGVFDVSSQLVPGFNSITVSISPMSIFAEIEPIYIVGDFNLEPIEKGFKITKPKPLQVGTWNTQGLPMYSAGIKYSKQFDLKEKVANVYVQLGKWNGTVAAVRVNGAYAGIIFTEPNNLNITSFVKKGENEVEVEIIGSLKNLLGPHHKNPDPGLVDPGKWYNIHHHDAGNDYQTYGYGLEDEFRIISYK